MGGSGYKPTDCTTSPILCCRGANPRLPPARKERGAMTELIITVRESDFDDMNRGEFEEAWYNLGIIMWYKTLARKRLTRPIKPDVDNLLWRAGTPWL